MEAQRTVDPDIDAFNSLQKFSQIVGGIMGVTGWRLSEDPEREEALRRFFRDIKVRGAQDIAELRAELREKVRNLRPVAGTYAEAYSRAESTLIVKRKYPYLAHYLATDAEES